MTSQPELFEGGETPAAVSTAQGTAAACSADALKQVDADTLRRLCLREYENRPMGATADEIFTAVKWRVRGPLDELSIRPRVTELKKEWLIVPTHERRFNRKMHKCTVLVHARFAKEAA